MLRWLKDRFRRPDPEPDPVAVVLLQRSHRVVSATTMNAILDEALGEDSYVTAPYGDGWRAFGTAGWHITVLPIDRRYIEPERATEKRAEAMIEEARAAILVDVWMAPSGIVRETHGLDMAGKIAAALMDEETAGVLAVPLHRLNMATGECRAALAAGTASTYLATVNYDGVEMIDHEEAEFAAKLDEARRRWPEFLARYRPGHPAIVKAAFDARDGREHMWIEVTDFRDGRLTGTLQNRPLDVPFLKLGDTVTVDEADVSDWAVDGVGPFTV